MAENRGEAEDTIEEIEIIYVASSVAYMFGFEVKAFGFGVVEGFY